MADKAKKTFTKEEVEAMLAAQAQAAQPKIVAVIIDCVLDSGETKRLSAYDSNGLSFQVTRHSDSLEDEELETTDET